MSEVFLSKAQIVWSFSLFFVDFSFSPFSRLKKKLTMSTERCGRIYSY